MDNPEIRLECLRLSAREGVGETAKDVVVRATQYADFVLAATDPNIKPSRKAAKPSRIVRIK